MSSTHPAEVDPLVPGDQLSSPSSTYLLLSFLGQGSFGKVAKCVRIEDVKTVAIKMLKDISTSIKDANKEVSVLRKLKSLDPDKSNIVQWYQVFTDRGRICLEFEHLDKSLHDFMKERHFRPLLLKEIRPIVKQLANALSHLKAIGIIHADVKWQNVMLVNHELQPYKVKLIDFGLACEASAAKPGFYTQTRPYRSPEIILGLPFTEAIDMWSLGCMTASLYLGTLLYPGFNEYDMIRFIVAMQGPLPDNLLSHGCYTSSFFKREETSEETSVWKLKTPKEFTRDTGIVPLDSRMVKLSSLDDFAYLRLKTYDSPTEKIAERTDVLMFVDMLKEMLQLDAGKRITPSHLLEHRFISLSHIVHLQSQSFYVKSCIEIMAAHPSQQDSPPSPPAESSDLNQSNVINTDPCTSSQTANLGKSGTKRKVDDEDENTCETSQPSKKKKSFENTAMKRHYGKYDGKDSLPKSYAAPSTSCSNSQTQSHVTPSVKTDPCTSSQTANLGKSGTKRKVDDEDENTCETSQPSKKKKSFENTAMKRHYGKYDGKDSLPKSYAAPSTSCSNSQTQSHVTPSVKRKRTHDEDSEKKRFRSSSPERHSHTKPAITAPNKNPWVRTSQKRKADDDDDDHDDVRPRKKPSGGQ